MTVTTGGQELSASEHGGPVLAGVDYGALFDSVPNPYVILDPAFRIAGMNAAYLRVTMRAREDILGRNIFEAFPAGPADADGSSTRMLRDSLERVLRTRAVDHIAVIKYDIPGPDGVFAERFWSATHTPLFNAAGELAFILQHTVDVTELQQLRQASRRFPWSSASRDDKVEGEVLQRAQAVQAANVSLEAERNHLRSLFEQAPGFMAVLRGPNHVFEIANAAYSKVIGHRDVVGKALRDALPEIVGQGFFEILDDVYGKGEPFVGRGIKAYLQQEPGASLELRYLDFVYQPIFDDAGAVTGIFVQGNDITDQKRAEEAVRDSEARVRRLNETLEQRVLDRTVELQEARDELQKINQNLESIVAARMSDIRAANEEIQRFAYIVSHDLRAPLVNIMGFTSELESLRAELSRFIGTLDEQRVPDTVRDGVDEDLPEAIGFIRSSTDKMDRLIKAILRLSREGRRVLAPEPLAMRSVIQDVLGTLAHQSEDVSFTIGDMPDIVSDRLAVEQIFANLAENAVKYLDPARPGRIAIAGAQDGRTARFAVGDNGRGIDARDFDRIFDLFRRSGAQDRPGEGIGLAHVRALVRRLGGTITVASELGVGTTFTVELPMVLELTTDAA
ncbi:hypothetical protein GCM10007036_27600 [Alsobacter metallidurans]|uniref:histidine kinase n=1 Tax=Alsobacter metallidurans TaxID=340221 RepID=A0A917I8V3_9HYPH|nr:ATP-binding protein [Alsobacter metallidurans]GGH22537.1 hypothetical protein GCM10007036_27600 [Alsobacter metallidurans]